MYCTAQDVRDAIKDDLLGVLLDDKQIADPAERDAALASLIDRAIADAGAEIDGYLVKNHAVPLVSPPPIIVKYAKDIAAYNLVSRVGIGGDDDRASIYRERYKAAVKFLEMLARGTVSLGLKTPAKQAASGFRMSGAARLFSRESMKGM